jgi:hypothetical protein
MEYEDLFSVLEDRVESLLGLVEQKDERLKLLEKNCENQITELSFLQQDLAVCRETAHGYSTIKKFLAFSIKDNYILKRKNEQTRERIRSLLDKLDLVLRK